MRYFLLISVLMLTGCTVSEEQITGIREQCSATFGSKKLVAIEKCTYDRSVKEIDAVKGTNGYPYKSQFQQLMAERIRIADSYEKKKISKVEYETANMIAEAKFNDAKDGIDRRNSDALGNMGQFLLMYQQQQDTINAANRPRFVNTTCTDHGVFINCNSY